MKIYIARWRPCVEHDDGSDNVMVLADLPDVGMFANVVYDSDDGECGCAEWVFHFIGLEDKGRIRQNRIAVETACEILGDVIPPRGGIVAVDVDSACLSKLGIGFG